MHSSSQEDARSSETQEILKLPYIKIKQTLDKIINVTLPCHIHLLKEKNEQIEKLKSSNSLTGLHEKQEEAAKYFKLLKADLSDIEELNRRIEEKDKELFDSIIKTPIKDAVETITKFMELHPNALEPFPYQKQSIEKLPFRRIKFALDQLINVALPYHTQLLKEKSEQIEQLKSLNSSFGLHADQSEAAKYLRLLKADLSELEKLNQRIEDKDQELFYSKIKTPIKDAVETVTKFMELHPDALEPFPYQNEACTPNIPPVICYLDQESNDNRVDCSVERSVVVAELTSCKTTSALPDWSFLRKEILEVHNLIRHFASLVFSQKDKVNTIQSNVEEAHENVQEGVTYLKKASILKATSLPLAGAILGGVLFGPLGAFAGLKVVGSITAVAGGAGIGYKVGSTLKKRREVSCDIEMKALTYPSREKSSSNPELNSSSKID